MTKLNAVERGLPVAKLVPAATEDEPEHLANVQGGLEDDDPFFSAIEEITGARSAHQVVESWWE